MSDELPLTPDQTAEQERLLLAGGPSLVAIYEDEPAFRAIRRW